MILKIIYITILFPVFTRAQIIEPLDSLISNIVSKNKAALQEQIALLLQYKEQNFLSLVPSIGYDLLTNRPLVNFSFNNFISFRQRKKDLKFQSLQIKIRFRNLLTDDSITCRLYYEEFAGLLVNYSKQLALLDSSFQLLQIKEEENKMKQATSEDVLKIKLELDKLRVSINQFRNQILSKALQLSLLIKRPLQYHLLENL